MKKHFYAMLLLFGAFQTHAQYRCQDTKHNMAIQADSTMSILNNAKSDTFDILQYNLYLDFTHLPTRYMEGLAEIEITPKLIHNNRINLDLLILQVDSILQDGLPLSYSHNDTIIRADLINSPAPGDTFTLSVYYHGAPPGDASGWGGWHQQSGYFYNLGVGFAANPHTYGRAWHPCFDNFVEKANYQFYVKTNAQRRPYCNGVRLSETNLAGDTLLTHWSMTDPIPTYLASVAISNYVEIEDTVSAMNGIIPIGLYVKLSDSLDVINSFVNLKGSLHSFEKAFGPYYWDRIGYCATTVGAMEHSTSIHFPTNLIDGSLTGEDIMAHELAHHWWGNLVTCETDADMWINEGMAEFSSHLYTEDVYDRDRYLEIVRQNAYNVITKAHVADNGYKAIQGLSHEYVYGYHVYQKGAMVAHNLRGYLGDSLFFNGLTTLLNNNKYGNLSSIEFRDQLALITGTNLNDFFDDWIFNPGFATVWVDSIEINGNNAFVRVRQGQHHAPDPYYNMPVYVTFFDALGNSDTRKLVLNGSTGSATFQNFGFTPVFAIAAYDGHIMTADTYDEYDTTSGVFYSKYANINVYNTDPSAIANSKKVIYMQHWDGPKGKVPSWADFNLSESRFWTIQYTDETDVLSARISFNGSPQGMDQDLLSQTADSLMVLFRKDGGHYWDIWPYQTKTIFINTPGTIQGRIELDSIAPGDYVLANTNENIGVIEYKGKQGYLEIFPNPAKDKLQLRFPEDYPKNVSVKITDMAGKLIYNSDHKLKDSNLTIDLKVCNSEYVLVQVGSFTEKVWLQN